MGFTTVRFGDAPAYLFAATEIARHGRYPISAEPFYFRAPGYPFFLAQFLKEHQTFLEQRRQRRLVTLGDEK